MLTKNQIKEITSLHQKKYRNEKNLFIAEGDKVVLDLLKSGWNVHAIYATGEFFQWIPNATTIAKNTQIELVTDAELRKMSALSTPNGVLAVAEINQADTIDYAGGLKLVLDGISDPGNLGTLIRIADWFGIDEIICSENTADCFNPKVVQSAMGSLFHVNVFYANLASVFQKNLSSSKLDVYGTVLDGENIYEEELSENGFILAGNESQGISDELYPFITKSLTIPGIKSARADSLNVAVATGIVCSEFMRRKVVS